MTRSWSIPLFVVTVVPPLAWAGCAGADPATKEDAPLHDAGTTDPFGNSSGGGNPEPNWQVIDDGGAAELPDGAIVYLALWDRPCPEGSPLDYATFAEPFFQSYCLACHSAQPRTARDGAPEGLNFDTLAEIQQHADAIWGVAGDGNMLMPQSGPSPSDDERNQLGAWLACGAPDSLD